MKMLSLFSDVSFVYCSVKLNELVDLKVTEKAEGLTSEISAVVNVHKQGKGKGCMRANCGASGMCLSRFL